MTNNKLNWRPSCSNEMLQLRSDLLSSVRRCFADRNYCEVETPLLSADIVVDAFLEPMEIVRGADDTRMFLQTSPEAGMKRLLAAGSGSIFQVTRSFRDHESGQRHNPEFTMVEWYGVDTTWRDQLQLTEDLVRCVWAAAAEFLAGIRDSSLCVKQLPDEPFVLTAYDSAFERCLGTSVLNLTLPELQALAATHTTIGNDAFNIADKDNLLNILLAEHVESQLGIRKPEFLHSYPATQAALAEQNSEDERTALRFELYWDGLELCNGYQELTDPTELRRRDESQNAIRTSHRANPLPGADRMLAAMHSGLPKCSGVALGFDRLLMSILGLTDIRQVISFPFESA